MQVMAISTNTKKLLLRIVLFLVYLLVGAAIFQAVENSHEKDERIKDKFEEKKKNFTEKYNISDTDMKIFFTGLKKAMKLGFDLKLGAYPQFDQWGFMNAFHFAGNVVTTIGYGHLAPLTVLGRFLCIIYALVGIPLTGLTLRSIGNRISETLAASIKSFDRRVYNRETEKLEIKTAVLAFLILILIILVPAWGFSEIEGWKYTDAVYFCFVTLTTIGFGDFVPGTVKQDLNGKQNMEAVIATLEFLNLIYMVVGLAVMSGVIVSISGVIEEKTKMNFGDPLEALRNIRVENLNSRALKKLGYRIGPNDDPRVQRLPPRLAPRAIAIVATNHTTAERSRSAETMDFQGPTPVLHLSKPPTENKLDATNPVVPGTRIFNNKVSPANVPDSQDNTGSVKSARSHDSIRKSSQHNSTCTDPSDEQRANVDDKSINDTRHDEGCVENNITNTESGVDTLQPAMKRDSKNELVVEVQLTPLPSPRASPIPSRTMVESPPAMQRSEPDIGDIETYEESIKGSIDSVTFPRDKTNISIDESKSRGSIPQDNKRTNDLYSGDTVISMDGSKLHEMAPVDTTDRHSRTANGFISKRHAFGLKKGKIDPVEHIDLGDKSVTHIAR